MANRQIALRTASIFFSFWLLIALLIADFPPPPGFMIIVMILLGCALLVYLRVPVYANWRMGATRGAVVRVVRDGFVAGMFIALLFLFSAGEPSVSPPGLLDHLIWFSVLSGLGIGNAMAVYLFGTGPGRRSR